MFFQPRKPDQRRQGRHALPWLHFDSKLQFLLSVAQSSRVASSPAMRWKWPRHFGNSAQGRTAEKASVAQVDHVELARFWGDEVKPTLCALIAQQPGQAMRSARAAVWPRLLAIGNQKANSIGTIRKCFLPWERKKGVLDTGVRILL